MKRNTVNISLSWADPALREIDLDCTYVAGDPGCHTMRNGDPGWPPSPAEVKIVDARYLGKKVKIDEEKALEDVYDEVCEIAEQVAQENREEEEARREDAGEEKRGK